MTDTVSARSPCKALGYPTRRHLCSGAAPKPVLRVSQKLVCAGLSEPAEGREALEAFFLQCAQEFPSMQRLVLGSRVPASVIRDRQAHSDFGQNKT